MARMLPALVHTSAKYLRGFASRAQGLDPELSFLVEVVVLVVLRPLQGQLQGETILGNLIDPDARGDLFRSRVGSARVACLGRRVGLR